MQCPDIGCGEPICVHGCFRMHEILIRNLVYHITRNANEVDDLVQEVFIKAYQSLQSFRGGSYRAYLAQIARNHCYDWIRRKKAKRAITYVELIADVVSDEDRGPEAILLRQELASEVLEVLDELGDPDREILLLRHIGEFSYDEIAAVMGMTPGGVRTRVSRARQRILENLERRELRESRSPQLG